VTPKFFALPMKTGNSIRNKRADGIGRQDSRALRVLQCFGIIWAFTFACTGFAQNRYQITRIPTAEGANSVALGINNQGDVVGYSFQGEAYQGFLYSAAQRSLTDVGSLGGNITAACALNDAGQVTGYSQDSNGNYLAFLFSRDQPMASLGTLDNASTSEAFGINKGGAIVGDSQSGDLNHRPVLFTKNSVQDLGLGGSNDPDALETAYAINEAGQIVGRHSSGKNIFHAFVLLDGNTTDLRTLGGTNGEALAINKSGTVVGDSDTTEGSVHGFAFEHSQLKDLGILPGFETASYARGINSSGDIVGESDSPDQKRAFLYTKNQLVELDQLAENLAEAGFKSLDVAYGINDKGLIVGYGTTSGELTAAFIAVPGIRHEVPAGGAPQPVAQRASTAAIPQPPDNVEEQPTAPPDSEDYGVFYTGLSSDEGNWVEAGNYGYCFRPRVSENWRPYRDGHWIWTDQGWYWDSSERFAWATYHYGRWVNIDGTGWCWVPGNRWAPAWVSWRESAEHIGWAPLPPEADVAADQPISSWSDSHYDIGPAAYAFISFAHWREPNYARYVERPERNIQIIRETRNVTNIVTQNNVINNFGPRVQTIERRTNHPIPQVQLALNRSTDPKANYGQTRQGNRLNVIAPAANLRPQAARAPSVQNRIDNPRIEKGWRGVRPDEATKLKKAIAAQNPPPKSPPPPTPLVPLVNPKPGDKGQVSETPDTTGSPAALPSPAVAAPGQKPPPNLLKPGGGPPNSHGTPGASPSPVVPGKSPGHGKRPVPPNLLPAKPSATPGNPAIPQSAASPVQERRPETKAGAVPPNLVPPTVKATAAPPANPAAKVNPPPATAPAPTTPPAATLPKVTPAPATPTPPAPTPPPAATSPKVTPAPATAPAPTTASPKVIPAPPAVPAPANRPPATPSSKANPTPPAQSATAPKPAPEAIPAPPAKQAAKPQPPAKPASASSHPAVAKPAAEKSLSANQPSKAPAPPVQRAPTVQPHSSHPATPARPAAPKSVPPKAQAKAPTPPAQHSAAPPPHASHPPAAKPPAQKPAPPKQAPANQKHEPAKGKPTPKQ
jgi:probable HAF family extracellular repeat protein